MTAGPQYYPDEPADPFPAPPASVEDREGRSIDLRAFGDGPLEDDRAEVEALVEFYAAFDPADRAQGIPPVGEDRVRDWLGMLLVPDAVNVVAWHGDRVVGHGTLVPDGDGGHELAIFVDRAYQRAGIGSHLLPHLLGEGSRRGVERVWLSVERWNGAAVSLYRDVGFETTGSAGFELEMALRLE